MRKWIAESIASPTRFTCTRGPCGAQTDRMAARLNHPLRLACAAAPQEAYSLMSCDNPNVTIDAVKRSEAGDRSIIVHLHELGNTHANARLQLGFPVEKCALCTLMEEETAPAATDGKSVSLSVHPFEIKIPAPVAGAGYGGTQ